MKEQILEAIFFSTHRPLSLKQLHEITGWEIAELEDSLNRLLEFYQERGIVLRQVAGGFQLVTHPQAAAYITKLHKLEYTATLSPATLETLAIIAYLQPITRIKIEKIRGVKVGGILKNLLEKKLISYAGHDKSPGKPPLYATTPQFLLHFGLNSLEDLPALSEKEIPDFLKGMEK